MVESRFEDGLQSYERAVHLDPLSYRANGAMGVAYWLLGQYEEADRWLRVANSLKQPALLTQFFRARLDLSMGRHEAAIESAVALSEQSHLLLGALGAAYGAAGNQARARETLQRLQQQAASDYLDPLAIAAVHVGLGDLDAALESVFRALAGRSPMAAFVHVDPLFQPLRGDPRFQRVRSELYLA